MLILQFIFWLSIILILYTFIGYPLSLFILDKIIKRKKNEENFNLKPTVSIIIPAHNEEKVIRRKLENLVKIEYPKELIEIIIASDNSTDKTNEIVESYINNHGKNNIYLYRVKKRQGKTNAQNEAVKIANGEILVFTDANAIIDNKSIVHLVSSFTSEDIIYVTGRLNYVNNLEYISSEAESNYWNYDLYMRKMESEIKTITSGNGALYAIKKNEYVDFDPIRAHDAAMPLYAALNGKRAVYNEKAIANEKAGKTSSDEFKRKVRMFRNILSHLFKPIKKYNVFKYGWFSYFYFCHRTLRLSLFILHIIFFVTNLILMFESGLYCLLFILQVIFYSLAIIRKLLGFRMKIFYYPYYYCITLLAQLMGAINQLTGKSKPFWDKAESTR